MQTKLKFFLFGGFVAVFLLISYFAAAPDGLLHVVFCDVGQGDAIYIRFPNGDDGLIDGGRNSDVLTCIGKHMVFWDRNIELVVLTHPQNDHFAGLTQVLKRYKVDLLLVPPIENEAKSYQEFKEIAKSSSTRLHNPYAKEHLRAGDSVTLNILWPERKWVASTISAKGGSSSGRNEQRSKNKIGTANNVLGLTTSHGDLNDFSIILLLSYKNFEVLFTGDAEYDILEQIFVQKNTLREKELEVLKVGHHGGKKALSGKLASNLDAELAVISVGAKNSYGHPAQVTLDLLAAEGSKIARTDLDGEIEVVSDGERWTYKSSKKVK